MKIILNKLDLKHLNCFSNYIDRINPWNLEEYIEILVRKRHNLPTPRILDAGEDWDVELEEFDEGSVEPDMIDFSFEVFCGEDYQLSTDFFLEILNDKYSKEVGNQYGSHKGVNLKLNGGFANGYKNGEWKYFTPSGKLISSGKYLQGKRVGEWNIYSQYGKNENIEIRDYSTYINEIPFYDSYYPNGNIRIKGNYVEHNNYQTFGFSQDGDKFVDLLHNNMGDLLEKKSYHDKKILTKRYINANSDKVKETYHMGTSKLLYKSILKKKAKITTLIHYNLDGSIKEKKEFKIKY